MPNNEHILINAMGMLYHEVSASNLVKLSLADGSIVEASAPTTRKHNVTFHVVVYDLQE
jgi:ribulose-5-phosphate 4-epimerase/fuculose-1-phosphate aldolase